MGGEMQSLPALQSASREREGNQGASREHRHHGAGGRSVGPSQRGLRPPVSGPFSMGLLSGASLSSRTSKSAEQFGKFQMACASLSFLSSSVSCVQARSGGCLPSSGLLRTITHSDHESLVGVGHGQPGKSPRPPLPQAVPAPCRRVTVCDKCRVPLARGHAASHGSVGGNSG